MHPTPKVIVIDGNISSGKTTYITMLDRRLKELGYRVTVVKEPVDMWVSEGYLPTFYSNVKRWSYLFQTIAFQSRIAECIKMFEENPDSDVFILERSCFTDNLFMSVLYDDGHVSDIEMKAYKSWWELWYRLMPFVPTTFVYLKVSVDECMRRRSVRNREGESDIPRTYFVAVDEKHDDFLLCGSVDIKQKQPVPVIVIDLEKDYREDSDEENKLLQQFIDLVDDAIVVN